MNLALWYTPLACSQCLPSRSYGVIFCTKGVPQQSVGNGKQDVKYGIKGSYNELIT